MNTDFEIYNKRGEFTICIVDDDELVSRTAKRIFNLKGYKCISCTNPIEALDFIENQNPSLVVLDIMMPFIDGLELLKRIRRNSATQNIPVLILSAVMRSEIESYLLGADCFVGKPFSTDELIDHVDNLMIHHQRNKVLQSKLISLVAKLQSENERLKTKSRSNLSAKEFLFSKLTGLIAKLKSRNYDEDTEFKRKVSLTNSSTKVPINIEMLLANLSHSLKNELGVVKNTLNAVNEGEYVADDIESAERSINYSYVLLNQYMQFLDVTKPVIKNVPLSKLVERIDTLLSPRISSNIEFKVDVSQLSKDITQLGETPTEIITNQDILLGALLELVNNSTHAIAGKKGLIILRILPCDSKICIEVDDNATGIPDKIVDKLFLEAVPSESGTGLGLWLNKKAIESIKGKLYLKETSPNGTTFVIELPISSHS